MAVLSGLFPSRVQPHAGPFVRERMFRVGRDLPLCVVSPTPWFPLQRLLRLVRPAFRPGAPRHEVQAGHDVWYPRFVSAPAVLKSCDGLSMALCAWPRLRALKRAGRLDLIDAHFAYPDGYAAVLLGRWLRVPVTVTLRGKEARQAEVPLLRRRLRTAVTCADRVFAVSDALRDVAVALGRPRERIRVLGNGVDTAKFKPIDRVTARARIGVPADARVIVSVGGLVERKGFHRVIECLPELRRRHPSLVYLVVGGPGPEGDWSARLRQQAAAAGLEDVVRFLGTIAPEDLHVPLSAADSFVLATSYEGWANVFLEAMACGLPVVTTNVGGNAQVVAAPDVGILVPFGDHEALASAIDSALVRPWDRRAIRAYAEGHSWDRIATALADEFRALVRRPGETAESIASKHAGAREAS